MTTVYKLPSDSATIKTEVVCPTDANPMGMLLGGRLVEWMDIAAAITSQTHSGRVCVTASINKVDFIAAANIGDIISIQAKVTRAFVTSMEVVVYAYSKKVLTGQKYLVSEAYFTFVALDDSGKATAVIPLKPVTQEEKTDYHEALKRKQR
ncbi:acyl-CoA thioesterase, partial [Flavihumibacter solisilvae]|uniref:acyl-CoA thioesterase n=1 Tax=Flavihumibacter solisilvae TaxID=1349421 RepID=UPI0005807A82